LNASSPEVAGPAHAVAAAKITIFKPRMLPRRIGDVDAEPAV
jgi:hypothetical protein